jgi:drug/metabolite transporter (DMT)-like permease
MRLRLLVGLVQRPLWLLGILLDVFGFGFEALAIHAGRVSVVQPLLAVGLVFALVLGAWLAGRQLAPRDWLAALAVTGGLAAFLVLAGSVSGRPLAPGHIWLGVGGVTAVLAAACAGLAYIRPVADRGVLLAIAAGLIFALSAALTKSSTHLLTRGLAEFFTSWEPYALAAAGILGTLLAQSAFQSGELARSLPALTVVPPIASLVIGRLLLHEYFHFRGIEMPLAVICGLAVIAGLFTLGRSPLAAAAYGDETPERTR